MHTDKIDWDRYKISRPTVSPPYMIIWTGSAVVVAEDEAAQPVLRALLGAVKVPRAEPSFGLMATARGDDGQDLKRQDAKYRQEWVPADPPAPLEQSTGVFVCFLRPIHGDIWVGLTVPIQPDAGEFAGLINGDYPG
jgi:hypothetical protein